MPIPKYISEQTDGLINYQQKLHLHFQNVSQNLVVFLIFAALFFGNDTKVEKKHQSSLNTTILHNKNISYKINRHI